VIHASPLVLQECCQTEHCLEIGPRSGSRAAECRGTRGNLAWSRKNLPIFGPGHAVTAPFFSAAQARTLTDEGRHPESTSSPHYARATCCDRRSGRPSLRAGGSTSRKPGVLGPRTLRRTEQVRLRSEPLRLPGGTTISAISLRGLVHNAG
jgi:hypothetical protein